MKRVAIAIAGMWIVLAQQPAAVHARANAASGAGLEANAPAMCGDASQPFLFNAGVFSGALSNADKAELGSASDPAPSEAAALQLAAGGAPIPAAPDDAPAWCITPDDPRCAPRQASAPLQPPLLLAPPCDFETTRLPQLRSSERAPVPPAAQLGAARLGVRARVERPPRRAH